ncbi:C-type lectin domain family 2 member B-like [Xenopus laevis]|uniref:C-type lectin domain-containing protein n=2 Tax=Xenopus laevis TaxID=8355 RepID=A0A974I5I7_XENLA|nr:C-type lectin domain family 2 member B-like [Xenopus laevis]OCU02858.1 hypothetical protein XELAEV_18008630mg [Xenopus laevis]
MDSEKETNPICSRGWDSFRRVLRLDPYLPIILLLLCLLLQTVSIFLRVTGTNEQISEVKGNISMCLSGTNEQIPEVEGNISMCLSGPAHRCPRRWILLQNKCYFFSTDKRNLYNSDTYCRASASILAQVINDKDIVKILIKGLGHEYWVGLTHIGTHHQNDIWTGRWADGSTEAVTNGSGSCVKIGEVLMLENCYTELRWACERDPA